METKCDTCKFLYLGYPTYHDPSDDCFCQKGHWGGYWEDSETTADPWADCQDYEESPEYINFLKPE